MGISQAPFSGWKEAERRADVAEHRWREAATVYPRDEPRCARLVNVLVARRSEAHALFHRSHGGCQIGCILCAMTARFERAAGSAS